MAEFLLVADGLGLSDLDPFEGRMRLAFRASRDLEAELISRMKWLGYSQALVRTDRYAGEGKGRVAEASVRKKRWLVGRQRIGDDVIEFTELFAADEAERLSASPHRRPFRLSYRGRDFEGLGSRGERRLSPCDARFLLNLSRARAGALVVDPFAGIGGIVAEAVARDMSVLCGDIDDALRLGLTDLSRGRACVWDARSLPLREACADAVVTEPPYSRSRGASVAGSLPELVRCLRPGGRLVVLVDPLLCEVIVPVTNEATLALEYHFPVRRQGFVARALCWLRQ